MPFLPAQMPSLPAQMPFLLVQPPHFLVQVPFLTVQVPFLLVHHPFPREAKAALRQFSRHRDVPRAEPMRVHTRLKIILGSFHHKHVVSCRFGTVEDSDKS